MRDMPYAIYWIAALAVCVLGLAVSLIWALRRPGRAGHGLPSEWSLTARPVFAAEERRVFRLLREALPHHVVLSKLPLVRFCQPTEAKEVRYWFDLLGTSHVTFAVCSPNGRVLAAIDLDGERGVTARSLQIKHAVLAACRVRYLRCSADQLPSVAELQLLVPQGNNPRGPQPASVTGPMPERRRSGMGGGMGGGMNSGFGNGLGGSHHTSSTSSTNSTSEDEFGSDWGQFSQPLPLWQDASLFSRDGPPDVGFGNGNFGNGNFGNGSGERLPRGASKPAPRAASMRDIDPAPRYGSHRLPVLDDAQDDSLMDDIVGVVVDTPRYSAQRPRR